MGDTDLKVLWYGTDHQAGVSVAMTKDNDTAGNADEIRRMILYV